MSSGPNGLDELRDSQLSAMYDGELPPAECELLARRLTRDPALRAQWSRYALIGAALRGEPAQAAGRAGLRPGVRQSAHALNLALPVSQALGTAEMGARDTASEATDSRRWRQALRGWAQPLAGAGIAAGVAALSIVWLQSRVVEQSPPLNAQADEIVLGDPDLVASRAALAGVAEGQRQIAARPNTVAAARVTPAVPIGTGEPRSYTVPPQDSQSNLGLAEAQLANYVVAHSEYAAPLNRRSVLSALIASDAAALVANPTATGELAPVRQQAAP